MTRLFLFIDDYSHFFPYHGCPPLPSPFPPPHLNQSLWGTDGQGRLLHPNCRNSARTGQDRTGLPRHTAAYSQSFLFACFSPVVISCRSVYQTQHFINAVQKLHHWIEPPARTFSFGNDLN